MEVFMYLYLCMYAYTYVRACMSACAFKCTHTRTQTHTHTYKYTNTPMSTITYIAYTHIKFALYRSNLIHNEVNSGNAVDMILFDISKAFDTVSYRGETNLLHEKIMPNRQTH